MKIKEFKINFKGTGEYKLMPAITLSDHFGNNYPQEPMLIEIQKEISIEKQINKFVLKHNIQYIKDIKYYKDKAILIYE